MCYTFNGILGYKLTSLQTTQLTYIFNSKSDSDCTVKLGKKAKHAGCSCELLGTWQNCFVDICSVGESFVDNQSIFL